MYNTARCYCLCSQYLGDVEDHLGESIPVVSSELKVAANEFDGKVVYGEKRGKGKGNNMLHIAYSFVRSVIHSSLHFFFILFILLSIHLFVNLLFPLFPSQDSLLSLMFVDSIFLLPHRLLNH